jgi:hypothetical protein
VRDLEAVLIQIVASASLLKRPIDLDLVESALRKVLPRAIAAGVDAERVVETVAAAFQTTAAALASTSLTAAVALALAAVALATALAATLDFLPLDDAAAAPVAVAVVRVESLSCSTCSCSRAPAISRSAA